MEQPWNHTLRELTWRADALKSERWDHTASITFHIARGLLKGDFTYAKFHPYLVGKDSDEIPLGSSVPEAMPHYLPEQEINERLAKYGV